MSRYSFLDRFILPGALSILAMLAQGCSVTSESGDQGTAPPDPATGPSAAEASSVAGPKSALLIAEYPVNGNATGMDARFSGRIRYEGRCVYVVDGSVRKLPVFPAGSITRTENGNGFVYRGRAYSDGDPIVLGGGENTGGPGLAPDFFIDPETNDCDTQALWIVSP